jgi:ankyrin repeat protein
MRKSPCSRLINFHHIAPLIVMSGILILAGTSFGAEIHELAESGDLESLQVVLRDQPDLVNAKNENGRTPLHLACRGAYPEVVKYLVAHGADVNARDDYQSTPLHFAAYRNLTESMNVLLEGKADANLQDHSKATPLHYAAMADQTAAVEVLIAAGAKLEIPDDYGRTPLMLCARERGGPQTINIVLEAGADVTATDRYGDDALELAAWRGKEEVVNLLLDAGAKVPGSGPDSQELFRHAADNGLERLFNALVAAGGEPDFKLAAGGTLVHSAAAGGSLQILQGLAARGLDLEARDDYGWTPLHYAARDGRVECVRWLCAKKVPIDARSLMGQTPYNVAVEREMAAAAAALKAAGADTVPIQFPVLEGPYLGQEPPGDEARLFARGIVSSIWSLHSSITFSPEGDDALWSPMPEYPGEVYSRSNIAMMTRHGGRWSPPRWAPFTGDDRGDVAFFAPGADRVYFLSRRTLPDEPETTRERIWYADRKGDGWAPARPVDSIVNDFPQHWQFSVDGEQTIYFSADIPGGQGQGDIYTSPFVKGKWQEPVNVGPPVNSDGEEATPFIAPDGSYLMVQRNGDLYLSYRTADNAWSEPKKLDERINSESRELCPLVSPDGKYLFFLRHQGGKSHVWWIAADFIRSDAPPK